MTQFEFSWWILFYAAENSSHTRMFPKMLDYHFLSQHIGCERLAYHQRHINFLFITWILSFGTLFDDISTLAEEVVIIRQVKNFGSPTPDVVSDKFNVPQPYCLNGVPNCHQFDAVAVRTANESCTCECDINYNKTAFSFLNNSWACRNDHELQSLSGTFLVIYIWHVATKFKIKDWDWI